MTPNVSQWQDLHIKIYCRFKWWPHTERKNDVLIVLTWKSKETVLIFKHTKIGHDQLNMKKSYMYHNNVPLHSSWCRSICLHFLLLLYPYSTWLGTSYDQPVSATWKYFCKPHLSLMSEHWRNRQKMCCKKCNDWLHDYTQYSSTHAVASVQSQITDGLVVLNFKFSRGTPLILEYHLV